MTTSHAIFATEKEVGKMSNDMPEEIYVRKVTKKTLSAIRPESPILLGCLDGKLMRTKYTRATPTVERIEGLEEDLKMPIDSYNGAAEKAARAYLKLMEQK